MRYPEDKIKESILHPESEIRQRAVRYFAKSYSTDRSIMPLVIKTVETFGREDAHHLIGSSRDLPQTEAAIDWIIDELNDEQSDRHENYTYSLSMVLVKADPALLLRRESDILESRYFLPDLHASFSERLQMLSWDEATCWQKLQDFCEAGKDKEYVNDVNLSYANRIVEALARYGDASEEKVHALLSQTIADYRNNPMKWMEPLVVRLAGEAHLDSTVPLIVAKLVSDGGDLGNEECAEALARIGSSTVVEAVAEAYSSAPHHFRLYGIGALEYIRSDLAVEKCLHVLRQEKDSGIRLNLAHALLSQFASEGIEEARQMLVGRQLDFESRGLRNYLVETCTFMGERFPEFDEWLATEKAEKEAHWRRMKELHGDPAGMLRFALEKLTGKKAPDAPQMKPPVPHLSRPSSPVRAEIKQRVGRNDPCPCGSGKKFKNCCIRKTSRS